MGRIDLPDKYRDEDYTEVVPTVRTSHGQPEEYAMTLTAEEAACLDAILRPGTVLKPLVHTSIVNKLNYSPPRFPVGTVVTRHGDWDPETFTVVGHIWNGPGNWTALAEGGWGVGETFLEEV